MSEIYTSYKPQPYCTQPRPYGADCVSCSLTSYGKDCQNKPIPTYADGEDAYALVMSEFRRRDIGTIADIVAGIHLDGCPPGVTGQARKSHVLDILRQIRKCVDEEIALQESTD